MSAVQDVPKSSSDDKMSKPGRRIRPGIRTSLLLLLLSILIPVLIIQAVIYRDRFQVKKSEELQADLQLARSVAIAFQNFLADVLHQEFTIGIALTSLQPFEPGQAQKLLKRCEEEILPVRDFHWIDPLGRIAISSKPASVGYDVSGSSYFRRLVAGDEWVVTDLIRSEETGKAVFGIARAIRNQEGTLEGVVAATVPCEHLDPMLAVGMPGSAAMRIMDRRGSIVSTYPPSVLSWEERTQMSSDPTLREALAGREIATIVPARGDREEEICVFVPVPPVGWVAGIFVPLNQVMAPVTSRLIRNATLFLLVVLASFLFAMLLSGRLSRSIIKLREHALELGRGKMKRIEQDEFGPAEVKDLAAAFNYMAEQIKAREQELRRREEEFRALVENAPDLIGVFDPELNRIYVNHHIERITGKSVAELIGQPLEATGYPEPALKALRETLTRVFETGREEIIELNLFTPTGRSIWLQSRCAPLRASDGSVERVMAIGRNITANKKMEEELKTAYREMELRVQERTSELHRSNQALKEEVIEHRRSRLELLRTNEKLTLEQEQRKRLSRELMNILEEDRRETAMELHDNVGQLLTSLKMEAELILRGVKGEKLESQVLRIRDRAVETIREIRAFTNRLRPAMLDKLGLIPSVRALIDEFRIITDLEIDFYSKDLPDNPDKKKSLTCYRIVQEALNNIMKHAKARHVFINLTKKGGKLLLSIEDDGVGFDAEAIKEDRTGSLGLMIMKERALQVGGELSIESQPGKGTYILAEVPL